MERVQDAYTYVKPISDPVTFSAKVLEFQESHKLLLPVFSLNKTTFSNVASIKSTLEVNTFHARIGQTFVSMLVHLSKTF